MSNWELLTSLTWQIFLIFLRSTDSRSVRACGLRDNFSASTCLPESNFLLTRWWDHPSCGREPILLAPVWGLFLILFSGTAPQNDLHLSLSPKRWIARFYKLSEFVDPSSCSIHLSWRGLGIHIFGRIVASPRCAWRLLCLDWRTSFLVAMVCMVLGSTQIVPRTLVSAATVSSPAAVRCWEIHQKRIYLWSFLCAEDS